MNRIWEYPDDKDIIPLSDNIWKMQKKSENDSFETSESNIDRTIDQSDLLTHKSKVTDYSQKEIQKSHRRIEKEKNGSRITETIQGYEMSSDQEIIQNSNPSKNLI